MMEFVKSRNPLRVSIRIPKMVSLSETVRLEHEALKRLLLEYVSDPVDAIRKEDIGKIYAFTIRRTESPDPIVPAVAVSFHLEPVNESNFIKVYPPLADPFIGGIGMPNNTQNLMSQILLEILKNKIKENNALLEKAIYSVDIQIYNTIVGTLTDILQELSNHFPIGGTK